MCIRDRPVPVKVVVVARFHRAAVRLPQCAQIIAAPVKGQPTFALQEDEKEQPVEEALRKQAFLFPGQPRDQLFHLLEDRAVGGKEVARHRLDVERLIVAVLDHQGRHTPQRRRQHSDVEQAQPFRGRAQPLLRPGGLVGADADTPEDAPRACFGILLILDIDKVPVILRRVGEDE